MGGDADQIIKMCADKKLRGYLAAHSTKIMNAISNAGYADFKDCLQVECTVSVYADYIISGNVKDYTVARVKAILPENFIESYI